MLKKLMSVILSVCMCISLAAVTVSAANYNIQITGWGTSILQCEEADKETLGVEIITNDNEYGITVPNGVGMLHVFGTKDTGNYNANAAQLVNGLEEGKTYRLGGKFYTEKGGYRYVIRLGGKELVRLQALVDSNYSQWLDGAFEFVYDTGVYGTNKDFKIQAAGNGSIYVDDLALCEVKSDGTYGENLLSNGDFEADFVKPDDPEFVSVASRNAANYIAVKTINDAVVYEVGEDGSETKLELDTVFSNATYNVKVLAHTGLTNNKTYRYIVKAVGTNGMESDGIAALGTPLAAYDDYIKTNNWSYKNNGSNYGTVSVLKGIGTSGSAGMNITNMSDSSANNTYQYICNGTSIVLEQDKVYRLTFMAKADEYNSRADSLGVRLTNSYCSADGVTYNAATGKDVQPMTLSAKNEWTEQTCYFKAGSNTANTLELRVYRHYENLVLDDFALYEVDDSLNVVPGAVNLLADKNGDFESFDSCFDASYKFYPAYGGEQFGEIMVEDNLLSLSDLAMYDADVLYIEAGVKNNAFGYDKDYTFIAAIYKDGALYDVKMLSSAASYLAEDEKVGLAYQMPDMSEGDFEVKAFILDGLNTITPLAACDGRSE